MNRSATQRFVRLALPVFALALLMPMSAGAGARLAAGTITGKVLKEDGTPAAKVSITVRVPGANAGANGARKDKAAQPADAPRRAKPVATTDTDDSGTFTLSVPAGEYVVQAGKRGESMGRSEKVTVEEGKSVTVEIKLKPAKSK